MRGVFKIHEEPESSNEGVCSRYMMNRNRQMRGHVCKTYDEPETPCKGACLESPHEGGAFKAYDDPESPNEGACSN